MDQSVFANIQITAAGATVPGIGKPLHQILLESAVLGKGKQWRSQSKDIFIDPSALLIERFELPVPVVMVGSQRSSDHPSSDAAINLINATRTAATSDIAEVMVCMFGPTSDEYGLLHQGTRVRKMHSSYRSTFRTIGDVPLAMVTRNKITPLRDDYNRRRKDRSVRIFPYFEEKVALLYYYPNMLPDIIDSLVKNGYRGIIIAGTGLGHVNKPLYPALKRAKEAGVAVYMTVQTLWGYVQMYVYETGREMMQLGVIPTANMLPEVAYVKLAWALGQTDDLVLTEDRRGLQLIGHGPGPGLRPRPAGRRRPGWRPRRDAAGS